MRATDDDNRIIYSMVNTLLGRMCISGDVYDLSDHQWSLIEEGIAFYNKVSKIIDKGMTTRFETWTGNYNHPEGEQIVVRKYENQELIVFHRFGNSKSMDMGVLDGKNVIASYGKADGDFTAIAYLVEV